MSVLSTIILAKNFSKGQIMRMEQYHKTRVYFVDGCIVYFPHTRDLTIDDTESLHITILCPKEWALDNVPTHHIVAEEVTA